MGSEEYKQFQLDLLRSWRLRSNGQTIHVALRQQRLIAALALRGPCLRTYIIGLLWPEHADTKALENLRVSLHMVCHALPGLLVNGGTVLSLSDHVDVDVHRLRARIREVETEAMQEFRLDLLPDLRYAELLPGWYEDWVLFEQNRLHHDRLVACTKIARESFSYGHFELAAEAAEAALELEPLYESAVRLLIQAEVEQGNKASAVKAFDKFQQRLSNDMGLQPSQKTLQLIAAISGNKTGSNTEVLARSRDT